MARSNAEKCSFPIPLYIISGEAFSIRAQWISETSDVDGLKF